MARVYWVPAFVSVCSDLFLRAGAEEVQDQYCPFERLLLQYGRHTAGKNKIIIPCFEENKTHTHTRDLVLRMHSPIERKGIGLGPVLLDR